MNIDSFNANLIGKYTAIDRELIKTSDSLVQASLSGDHSTKLVDGIAFAELLGKKNTVMELATNFNTAIHEVAKKCIDTLQR